MTAPLNLAGLPWFVGQLVLKTVLNEKCTPDHVLLMADALEECARELPAQTVYAEPCRRVVGELRDAAANYLKAPGKPLGDFDGSLTP